MTVSLSTQSVPPGDRLSYWHDVVSNTFVPLHLDVVRGEDLVGQVTTDVLGQLQISTVYADGDRVRRSRDLIRKFADEYLLVGLQTRGAGAVAQDGRRAILRPGQLAVCDTARPYTLDFRHRFEMVVFQMQRRALGRPDSELKRITGVTIGTDRGVAMIVAPFLARLAAEAGTYHPEVADMLAHIGVATIPRIHLTRNGSEFRDG